MNSWSGTGTWHLRRWYMLRVAALPVESVAGLRSPRGIAWADSVIAERDRLAAAGLQLSDALHEHIGRTADAGPRRALIEVRRQIYHNVVPREPAALALVEPDLGRRLAAWLRDRAALDDLVAAGEETVRREVAHGRAVLRQLAGEPWLRHGLLLASPSLDTYLDGYRTSIRPTLSKRERRIERSVMEYVSRIAHKTSPFSTFTGLVLGRFADDPGATLYPGRIREPWFSHPRLNVAVLGRLHDLIVANEKLCADLPVRLTPGWKTELDRIRYVRRSVSYGDDSATVGMDLIQTVVYYLSRSAGLERTLALLERDRDLRFRDFVDRVREAENASVEEGERWAHTLRRLGLLEFADLRLDIHDPDPVRSYAARLGGLGLPWADDLAGRLVDVAERIDAYAAAGVSERRDILAWLRQEFTAVQHDIGAGDATLPRTLLFEDVRFEAEPVVCGATEWTERIGTALDAVGGLLPAFDYLLRERMLLKAFFLIRYGRGGRCDDLLRFVYDFQEDIYDQYLEVAERRQFSDDEDLVSGRDNWLNSPELAALGRARQLLADGVRAAWAAAPADADELNLDGELIAAVARELAPAAPWTVAQSYFVQLARTPAGPLAVLNQTVGGLSFPFSRFTHCFTGEPGLADVLRADNRWRQPEGAVFAELLGGAVTTNLNLHGRLTDYQLVCPGETGSVPLAEQITADDLYLEHDEPTDRVVLRSRRLGREVVPVHLGYLMPMALPAIARVLNLFAPSTFARFLPWYGVPARDGDAGVTVRPRIRHRDVVVSRRCWTVEARALPARAPDDSDASWLLSWRTWQRRHRLPDQVFATFAAASDSPAPPWRAWSKPHHVDFRSYHSLLVLDHLARNGGAEIRLEEMLPTGDDLYVTSSRGHHVAEMVLETIRTGRSARGNEGRTGDESR
jgi:hypothetical protein